MRPAGGRTLLTHPAVGNGLLSYRDPNPTASTTFPPLPGSATTTTSPTNVWKMDLTPVNSQDSKSKPNQTGTADTVGVARSGLFPAPLNDDGKEEDLMMTTKLERDPDAPMPLLGLTPPTSPHLILATEPASASFTRRPTPSIVEENELDCRGQGVGNWKGKDAVATGDTFVSNSSSLTNEVGLDPPALGIRPSVPPRHDAADLDADLAVDPLVLPYVSSTCPEPFHQERTAWVPAQFKCLERLRRGLHGDTYRCLDLHARQMVAIKVYRKVLLRPEEVVRVHWEISIQGA